MYAAGTAGKCKDPCEGDVNGDGVVNVFDLLEILANWSPYGNCPPYIPADINEDCIVNVFDLLALLGGWGPC